MSIATIALAVLNYTTSEYATLSVEVRNDIKVLKLERKYCSSRTSYRIIKKDLIKAIEKQINIED